MQAVFSEYYCRVKTRDGPNEYIMRKRREFLSAAQNVQASDRVRLSTGAREQGVNVGLGWGVNVGRGRGVNVQDRGRGVSVDSRRGSGRGHSKGHERSNPERLRVAETSEGRPRRSKVRESDEFPVAKRARKSAGDVQVTNNLPNASQFVNQDDRSGVSRTGRSNPKRRRVAEKPRGRPRKFELRAPDVAPAAKRVRKSSGHSSSQLANGLPNSMQLPGQDDHSDTGPSLSVRLITDGHPELASNSQSHVHEATHAGRGNQILTMGNLSRKRGRVDSDLQFNDPSHFLVPSPGSAVATTLPQLTVPSLSVRLISDANHPEKRGRESSDPQFNDSGHFPVSSSELAVTTALPQSVRSVRPLPRRVSMKRILPRHAEQINRAAEPSVHALDQEAVDRFMKDVSSNASLAHFQPISGPLENWAQTKDNDQDDIVDVDEIVNEFDTPSANDAPLQVSSYEGAVEGSASTIQPRKPPLPIMPPIWAKVCTVLCEHTKPFNWRLDSPRSL